MITICHFSDWHGAVFNLPPADLYVCTGDALRNYPIMIGSSCSPQISKKKEMAYQGKYIRDNNLREIFGTRESPTIVVRGNHDFINLSHWIGGEVYEIGNTPAVIEVRGLKIGGYRGVSPINGCWSDEIDEATDYGRADLLPEDLDILVSHSPPYGIRDRFGNQHGGLAGLSRYATQRAYAKNPKRLVHMFGHIHEGFGYESLSDGLLHFSNAATGYMMYSMDHGVLKMTEAKKVPI